MNTPDGTPPEIHCRTCGCRIPRKKFHPEALLAHDEGRVELECLGCFEEAEGDDEREGGA